MNNNQKQNPAHVLWVELTTRITLQPLHFRSGNEETAVESVHQLFKTTRELMAENPEATQFNDLAVKFLNDTLRPYTARWHRWMTEVKAEVNTTSTKRLIFKDEQVRRLFRAELIELQSFLIHFEVAFKAISQQNTIPEETQKALDQIKPLRQRKANLGTTILPGQLFPESPEYQEIFERRKSLQLFNAMEPLNNLTGLALSGGGIRSATFGLGIVQTLAKKNLFHQFDYVSTVSGGGYLGTFLSSILADNDQADKDKNPKQIIDEVFTTAQIGNESIAIRHLRNSSKYLGTGGIEWMAGLMIYGILVNILLLLPFPLLAATLTYFLQSWGFWDFPQNDQLLLTGLHQSLIGQIVNWSVILTFVFGFTLTCVHSFTQGKHISKPREQCEAWTLRLAITALGFGIIYCLPSIFKEYEEVIKNFNSFWQIVISGTIPFLLAYGSKLLDGWKKFQKLLLQLLILSGPLFFMTIYLFVGHKLGIGFINSPLNHHTEAILVMIVALLLLLWGWWLVNINTTSPHRYYRNRLCDCYLVKRNNDGGVELRHFFPLLELFKRNMAAPYHLINTTINLTTSQNAELRGRNGDFFVISKHVCGSPTTGYYPTEEVVNKNPHLDLGTAMAISGAAASTNMGWQTMTTYRFLIGLLNLRLGYWLLNPNAEHTIRNPFFEGPGPGYLLKEITGKMNEKDRYLNLSDGGHIENLAVYELLRRKCKFIVCVDGGMEQGMEGADLTRLQRYAEIDLGIRMEYDFSDLYLNETGLSKAYAVLVKIIYSGSSQDAVNPDWSQAELGWMLYFKLAITGAEPAYVLDYRRQNPSFPHQTTADQFFDEAQFEAYRMLGECAAENLFRREIISSSAPATLQDWFQKLANNLFPDADPVFK